MTTASATASKTSQSVTVSKRNQIALFLLSIAAMLGLVKVSVLKTQTRRISQSTGVPMDELTEVNDFTTSALPSDRLGEIAYALLVAGIFNVFRVLSTVIPGANTTSIFVLALEAKKLKSYLGVMIKGLLTFSKTRDTSGRFSSVTLSADDVAEFTETLARDHQTAVNRAFSREILGNQESIAKLIGEPTENVSEYANCLSNPKADLNSPAYETARIVALKFQKFGITAGTLSGPTAEFWSTAPSES